MNGAELSCTAATAACLVPAQLRWLRVAQREHYLAGSVARFAWRWWAKFWPNPLAALVAVAALVLSAIWSEWVELATAAVVAAGPVGLSPRGTSSKLAWTRRLASLGGVCLVLSAGFVALGVWCSTSIGATWPLALAGLVAPLVVELALVMVNPVEARVARRWIARAGRRLEALGPLVVGVTGSYGKTTTKGYIARLCVSRYSVLASPKSFNNALGLARTVNQHLAPGTELLVAEMGTYGPGEIAAICAWMKPRIGVITAIGPVHLERFGSEERIALSKGELLASASVAVCNIDFALLAGLADRAAVEGKRVWTCSSDPDRGADVTVVRQGRGALLRAVVPGSGEVHEASLEVLEEPPGNLACALAVALELGVSWEAAVAACSDLPEVPHRLSRAISGAGAQVLDDTYNSNPAGAAMALAALGSAGTPGGRKVLVTPGMVELGRLQAQENRAFAGAAAGVADALVVVGRTNRRALVRGWSQAGGKELVLAASRVGAVEWVRAHLGSGDAVLYENDLPDHYL